MTTDAPFLFNPLDPTVRRDPYELYTRGRREFPAFRHEGLPLPIVSVFRYDDVQAVLRDAALFSNDFAPGLTASAEIQALGDQAPPSMIGTDPPDHTRLRSLVNKAFTPRIVGQLEPRLRQVARELVDEALRKGEVDLVQALTYPLPVVAIAEIIGVPPADRELLLDLRRRRCREEACAQGGHRGVGPDLESLAVRRRHPDDFRNRDHR